jgi:hypothetical protein
VVVSRNSTTPRRCETAQIVVVPLRQRNPIGVYASGYQTVPVLCYHRFGMKKLEAQRDRPAAFEQQMEWLAPQRVHVVTVREARPLPRRQGSASREVRW